MNQVPKSFFILDIKSRFRFYNPQEYLAKDFGLQRILLKLMPHHEFLFFEHAYLEDDSLIKALLLSLPVIDPAEHLFEASVLHLVEGNARILGCMRVLIHRQAAFLGQPRVHLLRIELFHSRHKPGGLLTASRNKVHRLFPRGLPEDFMVDVQTLLIEECDLEVFELRILDQLPVQLANLKKRGFILEHSRRHKEVLMLQVPLLLPRREESPAVEAGREFELTL